MGMIEDVMKALERIPAWKRVAALPSELDALKQRVAALELRLAPATGDSCKKCRAMTFNLVESKPAGPPWGDMGVMEDHYACSSCGYMDKRQRNPG